MLFRFQKLIKPASDVSHAGLEDVLMWDYLGKICLKVYAIMALLPTEKNFCVETGIAAVV